MKKGFKFCLLLLLLSFSSVVYANNVTLEEVVSDIKTSEFYKQISTEGNNADIIIGEGELKFILNEVDTNKTYTTSLTYNNGILSYTNSGIDAQSETIDPEWITQLLYSVAILNGYKKEELDSLDTNTVESFTLDNNGLEVKTYEFTKEYDDGSKISYSGFESIKIDISNFRLNDDKGETVDNPKTGSSVHLVVFVILLVASIGGFLLINKKNAFRRL